MNAKGEKFSFFFCFPLSRIGFNTLNATADGILVSGLHFLHTRKSSIGKTHNRSKKRHYPKDPTNTIVNDSKCNNNVFIVKSFFFRFWFLSCICLCECATYNPFGWWRSENNWKSMEREKKSINTKKKNETVKCQASKHRFQLCIVCLVVVFSACQLNECASGTRIEMCII